MPGVRNQIGDLAQVDSRPLDELQHLRQQRLRSREVGNCLFRIQHNLAERPLRERLSLNQQARSAHTETREIQREVVRHSALQLHELTDLIAGLHRLLCRGNDRIGKERRRIG